MDWNKPDVVQTDRRTRELLITVVVAALAVIRHGTEGTLMTSQTGNVWLIAAGSLSTIAALLHFACIVFGAPLYRALGAGEPIARAAERGDIMPATMAVLIGIVLLGWALYAFSAAQIIWRLPLTRTALTAIIAVLLIRGLSIPLMRIWRPDLSMAFLYITGAICTLLGLIFLIGTRNAWSTLSN
jgi:hypothetical protein